MQREVICIAYTDPPESGYHIETKSLLQNQFESIHGGVTPPTSKLRAVTEKFLMEKPNNTFCPTRKSNAGPHAQQLCLPNPFYFIYLVVLGPKRGHIYRVKSNKF